jgi:hypothetical protein
VHTCLQLRTLVLRRRNAYTLSFWLLPFLVTITVFVCIFFVWVPAACCPVQMRWKIPFSSYKSTSRMCMGGYATGPSM